MLNILSTIIIKQSTGIDEKIDDVWMGVHAMRRTKVAKIKQACESGETRRKKQHKQMIDEKAEDSDTRKQDYPTKKTRV